MPLGSDLLLPRELKPRRSVVRHYMKKKGRGKTQGSGSHASMSGSFSASQKTLVCTLHTARRKDEDTTTPSHPILLEVTLASSEMSAASEAAP